MGRRIFEVAKCSSLGRYLASARIFLINVGLGIYSSVNVINSNDEMLLRQIRGKKVATDWQLGSDVLSAGSTALLVTTVC